MVMKLREAIKALEEIGFKEVKGGGKGSHRKYEKAGERPITLPSHDKEISRIVEKTVKKAVEKAKGK